MTPIAVSDRGSATLGSAVRYGLPFLAHSILLTPLITFIPAFYSGDFGLPLAVVGSILFATRLSLVVAEPMIGALSDRTRTRFGRRKPWIMMGLPVLMLSTWMVFAPPVQVTPLYATFWIAVALIALAVVDIPYRAWGAELSKSYTGRTRVAAWREGFGVASSLLALAMILAFQVAGDGDTRTVLFWMGALAVTAMPMLFAFTLLTVPEPPAETLDSPRVTWREAVEVIARNKPFLWLMGGLAVFLAGAIIGASLHLIVMDKVFHARRLFPIILAAENIAGLVALPFWLWLARTVGKHRALAAAAAGMALFSFPIPLIPHDQAWLYGACIVTRGLCGGAIAILIASMVADVVDLDTLEIGRARNGLYFALLGALSNLGGALGALVGTALPAMFGFETSTAVNTDSAVFALMVTYAWIPMLIMGASAPFFWIYPLTEDVQKDLRRQIEVRQRAREGGAAA